MKEILFGEDLVKKLREMKKRDKKLFAKVEKQLLLFRKNPRHPSLRLHKLKGQLKDVWSISVTQDFRLVFIDNEEYYFFDMGTHDEVYR